ncbi:cytochrome P450 3A14-like [Rhipicephalus sanguineus]|uniref:cytochrome P450 3A14-like n=1 Tax=Rhipicephalus sanguineus TaxID=34632 RepID=UPI0020C500B4|nr:cytochrome P450 3A14-like [Rhipicephalus sanguineus]
MGYDTTSTSLSYLTYLLAKHQDVQDRVRKEINDAVSSTEELDYETVTRKLPYLSQVVNEALRLYPPVLTFTSRKAVNDFEYNGVHYKAGTCFLSPTLHIHRDERYWPDPLNFNPERFAPENEGNFRKVAYQAFGIGPRYCVGMRMALMALNLTIARLVQRFHLHLGPSQGEVGVPCITTMKQISRELQSLDMLVIQRLLPPSLRLLSLTATVIPK